MGEVALRERAIHHTGMAADPSLSHEPQSSSSRTDRDRFRGARIVGFVGLSAIGAELLAAYNETTGDAGLVAVVLVIFAALYGAPALLARDIVRRAGWGWPSLILVYAALGVAQACLIDQSMFAENYQSYEGWDETRAATFVPALGISAFNAYNFVIGHVVFSFAAPAALAEAWSPRRAGEPWLGPTGTALAAFAYIGAAGLVAMDPTSQSGSAAQLGVSAAVVATLIGTAILVGRSHRAGGSIPGRQPPPVWATLCVAFCIALITGFAQETWSGFAFGLAWTAAAGGALLFAAHRWSWSPRHAAAVGLAYLLVRGLLAFTYFPLAGDVSPAAKYTHNVLMLAVVAAAGWFALRRPGPSRRDDDSAQNA